MISYKWCIFSLVALLSSTSFITATTQNINQTISPATIVVDGTEQCGFRSVQSAIDSIPPNNQRWITIHVKAGYYREQVMIPRDKPFIHLKGEGKRNTFIVSNGHGPINETAAFTSQADYTLAQDITFTNSCNSHHRHPMATAVAARIEGDKSAFYRCGFFSLQDTLWDVQGRHYFKDCTIYGAGQSLYESCTIWVAALNGVAGYITAQGRGNPHENSGFVFNHCTIIGKGKAFLGRPWRDHARVLFYNTSMSDVVVPQGWNVWDKADRVKQLTLSEYSSRGPGAKSLERVKWAKRLTEEEAKQLASISFIANEGWLSKAFTMFVA